MYNKWLWLNKNRYGSEDGAIAHVAKSRSQPTWCITSVLASKAAGPCGAAEPTVVAVNEVATLVDGYVW